MKYDEHPVLKTMGKTFDFATNPIYAGNNIRTSSGIYLDVFNMHLHNKDIFIKDIAHALSLQCRFSGHIQTFYSVAEHSLRVAELVPDKFKLAALLHDASEAYIVDIPAPIKPNLPSYKTLEDCVMHEIAKKYKFNYPLDYPVKKADIQALEEEWKYYMLSNEMDPRPFKEVEKEFINKFYEYEKYI
jgi:5'-deoxynucleotidase YfbR-like HD superfamily hydrolase